MRSSQQKPNRLLDEKSPYLLQHAYNPVSWHPWGEEAFQKARKEDKPVFLSIGYSTCHWCHVMAHESFEDEEVAKLLNRSFVSVKVDREERPDIDAVYMAVCQAFTGSGGWPLTILMTPEKKPFFAGTYLPKKERYGTMGLIQLLRFVEKNWTSNRNRLIEESERITKFMEKTQETQEKSLGKPLETLIKEGKEQLKQTFDPKWGGFGPMPKFPTPHNLLFLLAQEEKNCTEMAEKTLAQMYRGGIFDHIGGGFCRYSTDERWLVPHFEKMLYDNALLLLAYTEGSLRTGKALYRNVAAKIVAYIMRELTHEEGGFFCSQDADSEGQEGKYYVFAPGEIIQTLGETEGRRFCEVYDIDFRGNFEGKSIPNLLKHQEYEKEAGEPFLGSLYRYRKQRTMLHRDEKILTGWNGLMIAALARAGVWLEQPDYLKAALRAEEFVWKCLRTEGGKLLSRWYGGQADFPGTLEDYAFFSWALLECYAATFEPGYLRKACLVAKEMLEQFFGPDSGGGYLYGKDSEKLLIRPKETYDGAMPSGNAVAALVMRQLAFFTGEGLWQKHWEQQENFLRQECRYPARHTFFLWVLSQEQKEKGQLICVSPEDPPIQELRRMGIPVLVKTKKNQDTIERVAPFLKDYPLPEQGTDYYFCQGQTCHPPVRCLKSLEEFTK
ncbi:MAG: thioredoxin domain-containing protein [Firmicutes bacterium]|jgi:uncharacterized protein YyaL (SSP411 family)|nr:thioredoxin domain-containing protein [Bacillota bacterium]